MVIINKEINKTKEHPLLTPYVMKWMSSTWYEKFAEEFIVYNS